MEITLHHTEMCVKDGLKTLHRLQKFGLDLWATRVTPHCLQWVVSTGKIYVIVTERKKANIDDLRDEDWTVFCCESSCTHSIDRVFNVAFQVQNVADVTKMVSRTGKKVIKYPTTIIGGSNSVTYSIIQSGCDNVVHTLIKKNEDQIFIPGFEPVQKVPFRVGVTHVDHVTLACSIGQSEYLVEWYRNIFGMRRFKINRDEDEESGLVIKTYGAGFRLKAMEYWNCAETELICPPSTEESKTKEKFILVIVEPLPDQASSKIQAFLTENQGPGVEHVAMYATDILKSIAAMSKKGAAFRQPPAAYYGQVDKLKEIEEVGESVLELSHYGILLDSEADNVALQNDNNRRFLMQIFSHNVFEDKTFFFEVIERRGARGLGTGNIIALATSIEEASMGKVHNQKYASG